eukprot:s2150_g8.t1
MDMIGQRLYTGRTGWVIAPSFPTWHPRHQLHVIAMSTLVFARTLYKSAREYADNKMCWSPQGGMPLSSVPQLAALYLETDKDLGRIEASFGLGLMV